MSESTYDMLLDWAESQLGDFDTYDDISEFEKDLLSAPGKAKNVDGRTAHARKLLEDWFNGNLDVTGYDADAVKGAILEKEVDKASTAIELDSINVGAVKGPTKGRVQDAIDKKRNELVGEGLQGIRGQIASALSKDELPDITMGEIRRQFGDEAREEISDLLAGKREGFKSLEEEFRESIESRIAGATTRGQLDALERSARDAPTERLESDLLDRIAGKRGQL